MGYVRNIPNSISTLKEESDLIFYFQDLEYYYAVRRPIYLSPLALFCSAARWARLVRFRYFSLS